MGASPEGILGLRCVRNENGDIEDAIVITANEQAADILGCSVANLVERPLLEVAPRLRNSNLWARCCEVVTNRQPSRLELSRAQNDSTQWFDVKAMPLGDGLVLSIADITRLKEACRELEDKNRVLLKTNVQLADEIARRESLERELRRLADVDVLTGVATRRAFIEAAEQALTHASESAPIAIILLDIDHFKIINDRYGHIGGDKVLAAVGKELMAKSRAGDLVGRLGGEDCGASSAVNVRGCDASGRTAPSQSCPLFNNDRTRDAR